MIQFKHWELGSHLIQKDLDGTYYGPQQALACCLHYGTDGPSTMVIYSMDD